MNYLPAGPRRTVEMATAKIRKQPQQRSGLNRQGLIIVAAVGARDQAGFGE